MCLRYYHVYYEVFFACGVLLSPRCFSHLTLEELAVLRSRTALYCLWRRSENNNNKNNNAAPLYSMCILKLYSLSTPAVLPAACLWAHKTRNYLGSQIDTVWMHGINTRTILGGVSWLVVLPCFEI